MRSRTNVGDVFILPKCYTMGGISVFTAEIFCYVHTINRRLSEGMLFLFEGFQTRLTISIFGIDERSPRGRDQDCKY